MPRPAVVRRQALGSSPLADVSAKRQRALAAARDHAFGRVMCVGGSDFVPTIVSEKPEPKRKGRAQTFPEAGAIDQLFREARKIR